MWISGRWRQSKPCEMCMELEACLSMCAEWTPPRSTSTPELWATSKYRFTFDCFAHFYFVYKKSSHICLWLFTRSMAGSVTLIMVIDTFLSWEPYKEFGRTNPYTIPCWMPKPLPPRNQCTGWFAPALTRALKFITSVQDIGWRARWYHYIIYGI